ncbi:Carbonic anhydrase 2 [Gracilariopsis chorda]|uniref:Carbonic anhydrase n=1 Tax=Gracilariopsis chorda TaxID=448386 RepID=A0A2V3J4A0_9FLOR|nr:Carbonic anhydrase 2 [Gracilariopsis chorda]|eukprot:PXF48952.1 Carbonic anhydrase 2 [Gracilariopsis chorda]
MASRTEINPAATAALPSGATRAQAVLQNLLAANAAFVNGEPARLTASSVQLRRHLATHGQSPSTVVITCADSRVSPEIIFGASLGDLFVIRNAGNVTYEDSVQASVEYAVTQLKSPLVLVMGHSKCGAVAAATAVARGDAAIDGCLGRHIHRIAKGVDAVRQDERVAVETNVREGVNTLLHGPVVGALAKSHQLTVLGAVYDISTGQVFVLDN